MASCFRNSMLHTVGDSGKGRQSEGNVRKEPTKPEFGAEDICIEKLALQETAARKGKQYGMCE